MLAVVADDDQVTTRLVAETLRRWGVDVQVARDGNAAWDLLDSPCVPSLAILDWMMPGLDGIELCRLIRSSPSLAGMYVILLTGRDSRLDLIAALNAGADDHMVKPLDLEEFRARVQVGVRVARLQANLAERVSELQSARDYLARLASTDVLTDVYSRRGWFDLASTEFTRCRRSNRQAGLMALDLDHFKRINDTYGHEAGDRVLQRFADLLRLQCRQSDVIGRLGGEEFAVLVPEATPDAMQQMAGRIRDACRMLVVSTDAGDVRFSCSIGMTHVWPEDDDLDAALRRADAALYDAKRSGRDRWTFSEALECAV